MPSVLKIFAGAILECPKNFDWSVQGLGMMRLYLDPNHIYRLHIWDSSLKVPGVSALHTHPWDLESTVVAGVYKQHRYIETVKHLAHEWQRPLEYNKVGIKCGAGACLLAKPTKVLLSEQALETLYEDGVYTQRAEEIHLSVPEDGTVTLVKKTMAPGGNPDNAYVYWPGRGNWVSAEPRKATLDEIETICQRSLERWF